MGFLISFLFLSFGILVRYYRAYGIIAGYNTASKEEKKKYDIVGLAHHLGNGMICLGVLGFTAITGAMIENETMIKISIGLVLFVSFIMVVGGKKFTPKYQHPKPGFMPYGHQRLLKKISSRRVFEAIKTGTQKWCIECPCGYTRDFWEVGGIRFKAVGEPRQYFLCPECKKGRWHKLRKKLSV